MRTKEAGCDDRGDSDNQLEGENRIECARISVFLRWSYTVYSSMCVLSSCAAVSAVEGLYILLFHHYCYYCCYYYDYHYHCFYICHSRWSCRLHTISARESGQLLLAAVRGAGRGSERGLPLRHGARVVLVVGLLYLDH